MKHLKIWLGLVKASEQELLNAFSAMAERHNRDFGIHAGCRLFSKWSGENFADAEQLGRRHGMAINSDPGRLRSALFHGMRLGGYGLLRDLQDLLLLAHQAQTAWTTLEQAAKELQDPAFTHTCQECKLRVDREIDWLCTHIKTTAPQALTVPMELANEITASFPHAPKPAGIPEMGWSPVASGATVLAVGLVCLAAGQPWLFPSLGPTAYLIAEEPEHPNTRFYNIVVGHSIGLAAGFLSVSLFGCWSEPSLLTHHLLSVTRVGAATLAMALTVLLGNLAKASHPPAAATTLLVALGALSSTTQAIQLAFGAVVMAIVGLAVRGLRTKASAAKQKEKAHAELVLIQRSQSGA